MTLIVNLFGGPCSYKSTIAAEVFAKLKWDKISCELVHEFAKQKIYEENVKALELQFSLGFNQLYNQKIVMGKVDVVITDSPFILSNVYNEQSNHLNIGFVKEFKTFHNMNYFLIRDNKNFTEIGRIHTLEQSIEIDIKIRKFLDTNGIAYEKINADKLSANKIVEDIKRIILPPLGNV